MMGNFLSITRNLKTIMTADGRIRRGCCIPHISAVIIYFVGLRMVLLYGKRGFPLTGTGMRMGMWMFCRLRNSVQGYIFPTIQQWGVLIYFIFKTGNRNMKFWTCRRFTGKKFCFLKKKNSWCRNCRLHIRWENTLKKF